MLKGIIPVTVVPMTAKSEPDVDGIHNLSDFLIDRGVGGFWSLGSASEDINMSFRQKVEVAREIDRSVNGRVPVIMGTGLTSIPDILEYASQLDGCNFHGLHVLPYDVKMGDSRLINLIETLADELPWPVWLYHNPKRGKPFSDNVISVVKEHSNVGGMKIGGYNLSELTGALLHKSESFDVIGAGGGQLFQMLSMGAEAHTTSEASVFPEPFIELYRLFKEGSSDAALTLQHRLIELSRSMPRTDNGEHSAEEKYMLMLRGVCDEYVNSLYRTLSDSEKYKLKRSLISFGFEWAE
ncbi:dihydrodipicolinate synthase family protein [Aliamphritea ceti]|uniref:dihydrodipicolinate synthase family protein n=1 Tax=Aliamphritea ceti TaxID=1524258 RepID=UPI0021C35918|nr:dihydrodipicolinate synthase family protein [Aliamphritea ceti]